MMIVQSRLSKIYTEMKGEKIQTQFGKAVDPLRDLLPCETPAEIISEMIAVLRDQMICVPMVALRQVLKEDSELQS
jgi:hypothetical protein